MSYKALVICTAQDQLNQHGDIIELHIGYGVPLHELAKRYKLQARDIDNIILKYYPKETGRNLFINVESKLNYAQAINEYRDIQGTVKT